MEFRIADTFTDSKRQGALCARGKAEDVTERLP